MCAVSRNVPPRSTKRSRRRKESSGLTRVPRPPVPRQRLETVRPAPGMLMVRMKPPQEPDTKARKSHESTEATEKRKRDAPGGRLRTSYHCFFLSRLFL